MTEVLEGKVLPLPAKEETQEDLNQQYSGLCMQIGDQVYKILKQLDNMKAEIDKVTLKSIKLQAKQTLEDAKKAEEATSTKS